MLQSLLSAIVETLLSAAGAAIIKFFGLELESYRVTYRVTWRNPESGARRSCGRRSSSRPHLPCW